LLWPCRQQATHTLNVSATFRGIMSRDSSSAHSAAKPLLCRQQAVHTCSKCQPPKASCLWTAPLPTLQLSRCSGPAGDKQHTHTLNVSTTRSIRDSSSAHSAAKLLPAGNKQYTHVMCQLHEAAQHIQQNTADHTTSVQPSTAACDADTAPCCGSAVTSAQKHAACSTVLVPAP
jgi:hypothetical protein